MSKVPGTYSHKVRTIEGIPGTVDRGYVDREPVELMVPLAIQSMLPNIRRFRMGDCNILVGVEPQGANGEALWHLTISCVNRHPTWDEIKVARYKLLPLDLVFAMFLPQPENYINVDTQDHVFQLWEVHDDRRQWEQP